MHCIEDPSEIHQTLSKPSALQRHSAPAPSSMASAQSAIKIFARIKPIQGQGTTAYEINTSTKNHEILTVTAPRLSNEQRYVNNKPDVYNFRYARVFDATTRQDQIFVEVARPVIDSGLLGYNGTIFAYGQTGSGKTFTMTGSNVHYDQRGLTPRALEYIFSKFEADPDVTRINSVAVSYLEIYNDTGYDLLHMSDFNGRNVDDSKVSILEDGNSHIHFKNLSVHPIQTLAEAFQLLMIGDRNRTIAETPLNDASTRSHCIFTIHLNVRDADSALVKRSKINLVDLAGSERIANSCVTGHLLVEARHINLALHYLEQVIVALSERNREHIPYRNSMMTQLLRDSLGGNCLTAMIATLSMERKNLQETLSTNRFAQRVALVTNAPVPNEEVDPTLVISHLKAEIRRLKETVASSSIKILSEPERLQPLTSEEQRVCETFVEEFLLDQEPNAILPIRSDMRLIQECFRLLKSQVGKPKNSQMAKIYGNTKLANESAMAQLVARREAEIKVLVSMLKKEKAKNCPSISSQDLLAIASNRGRSDKSSPAVTQGELSDEPNLSVSLEENEFEEVKSIHPSPPSLEHSETTGPREALSPRASVRSIEEGSMPKDFTGLKKRAMAAFLESYSGTPALDKVRANLLKKKEEVVSLEAIIESQRNNMVALRQIMTTASNPESMFEAYQSQQRTSDMQKDRLRRTKEQVAELETGLKAQFRHLLDEFEAWWRKNEDTYTDVDVNEVDSNLNMEPVDTEESEQIPTLPLRNIGEELQVGTKRPIRPAPSNTRPSTSTYPLKPLNVKNKNSIRVEGQRQQARNRTSSSGTGTSSKSTSRATSVNKNMRSSPPHTYAETNFKKLNMSRRHFRQGHGYERFDQPQRPAQDFYYNTGELRPPSKAAPATPSNSRATTTTGAQLQFQPDFAPINEEDGVWIKDLPLTGHAETDKEIVKFFRSRRQFINTQNQTKLQNSRR